MTMTLISPAFADGELIPETYTRLGENIMPALKWTGAPEDVKSFALIVEDPDAPRGVFRHCGVFNIPRDWSELPQSSDTAPGGGPSFCRNDFGNSRYDGPEPPKGHGPTATGSASRLSKFQVWQCLPWRVSRRCGSWLKNTSFPKQL